MINAYPSEIEDWKNDLNRADKYLSNLVDAISKPEYEKLKGNIERIKEIRKELKSINKWLDGFKQE